MSERPNSSLGRVLDDLGSTLLELVCGDATAPDGIGGVAIHDPFEEPVLPPYALVLGVGVGSPDDTSRLLRALGRQSAAGLVVRAPVRVTPELASAVAESGVALLALTRGASWTQLAALLRSLLAEDDVGDAGPQTLGGLPSGDLFAVANAVAALIDAPVTIEDRSSRVLAFSGRQDEADQSRVETILGRQVPEKYSRLITERGVFQHLYSSDDPVYVEPLTDEPDPHWSVPRVAVAVRAGDEFLGSIWAAVHTPLSPDRTRALVDAAKLVALHLLRIRAGADVERRLRTDLLATALEGGPGARDALTRLGLADLPMVVVALTTPPIHVDDAAETAERQRLADGLAMHLSAVHPRSATALIGDTVYGLVPVGGVEHGIRVASGFLDRIGDRVRAVVGVGPVVADAAGLADARADADRAVRVLRAGQGSGRRVATLADVYVESLVLELRDLVAARGARATGPVARLVAYDDQHNTNLVETLRAWLDAFGDVIAAAGAVHVHPNTFRYRLRRLTEISGLDLTDPDARFAAMLQLRVVPLV